MNKFFTAATNTTRARPERFLSLTFALFVVEFCLREVDIDGDVEIADDVVLIVLRQAFALLLDARAGPCDLLAVDRHRVTIEMSDVEIESVQSVLQRDGEVRVEIVLFAFE